jgi:hypothetical protein
MMRQKRSRTPRSIFLGAAMILSSAFAFTPREHIGKPPPFPVTEDVTASSSTARDSTVLFDWEHQSAFDHVQSRAVEIGAEHKDFPEMASPTQHSRYQIGSDDTPIVQAIFCGYITTAEDYNRLKSANVD